MSSNSTGTRASEQPSVTGVNATSGGLLKATVGSLAVALAVLTFFWLPAEYGVDPTGVGKALGLTDMGHIKQQLQTEADEDAAALLARDNAAGADYAEVLRRLDYIQAQLDRLVSTDPDSSLEDALQGPLPLTEMAPSTVSDSAATASEQAWRDQVDYTLEPGQGIEIKMVMEKGAIAEYAWTANGAVLNHDTHGDGNGQNISYKQGRAVSGDTGAITAAFTGYHGWFWRNRSIKAVTVTLQTRGDYQSLALPQ